MPEEQQPRQKRKGGLSLFSVIRIVRFGGQAVRAIGTVGAFFANPASLAILVPVGLFILALVLILFATGAAPPSGGGEILPPPPSGIVVGCPTTGKISTPYGYNIPDYPNVENIGCTGLQKCHNGVDIAAAEGTIVRSVTDGIVMIVASDNLKGNYIEINNSSVGIDIRLEHLKEISVAQGKTIKKGDIIGKSGQTGAVTGPTLHYSIIKNGVFLNPLRYLTTSATLDAKVQMSSDELSQNNYNNSGPVGGDNSNWGACNSY